jgi:hypothetical protein
MSTELVPASPPMFQVSLFAPTPAASRRAIEFFTAQINNDHTRKAYLNAAREFAAWCEGRGIAALADVQPRSPLTNTRSSGRDTAIPETTGRSW